MALLNEKIRKEVRAALADVSQPVTFKVFTQPFECQYCKETRELVEEVASLSDKVSVEVYDFMEDKALADSLGIDKSAGHRRGRRARTTVSACSAFRPATNSAA